MSSLLMYLSEKTFILVYFLVQADPFENQIFMKLLDQNGYPKYPVLSHGWIKTGREYYAAMVDSCSLDQHLSLSRAPYNSLGYANFQFFVKLWHSWCALFHCVIRVVLIQPDS